MGGGLWFGLNIACGPRVQGTVMLILGIQVKVETKEIKKHERKSMEINGKKKHGDRS